MATSNENKTPWKGTHPGTILRYELEERNISQKDFAILIDMPKSHLNELIHGKRPMSRSVAERIEKELGISAVTLVNMQNQYEHDRKVIEQRGVKELEAKNTIFRYNDIFDVKTLLKRLDQNLDTYVKQVDYLTERLELPQPAELQLEASGMFKKSSKTGQDPRMLMTWKLLAEAKAKEQKVSQSFDIHHQETLVNKLVMALHRNQSTVQKVKEILSEEGIAFCIVKKVDKASVDGYSFIKKNTPYIILTKRYDRIDNFAFALMHEIGHLYLHYQDGYKRDSKLSIPDYDNESPEEKAANVFAANALIPDAEWKKAPKVKLNPTFIQREYSQWAKEKGLNYWIVLGRISYETGMYKFRSDESRKINA